MQSLSVFIVFLMTKKEYNISISISIYFQALIIEFFWFA